MPADTDCIGVCLVFTLVSLLLVREVYVSEVKRKMASVHQFASQREDEPLKLRSNRGFCVRPVF